MEFSEEVISDIRKRLHRAMGQVRAVETMMDDGRDCKEVITQLSAATRALEQVGFRIVASGLVCCLQDPEKAEKDGYSVEDLEKLFLKIS